jgi:hypothetical protein
MARTSHSSNSSDNNDNSNVFYVIIRYAKIPKKICKKCKKTTKVYLTGHHILDYYMLFDIDKRSIRNDCKFKSVEEAEKLIDDLTRYAKIDSNEFAVEVY